MSNIAEPLPRPLATSNGSARQRPPGSTVDYVVEAIQTGIREGVYVPGQRLVEADLTAALGVSRGTLREGILRLAAIGLVELQANRGCCVARASRREIHDVFIARAMLEGEVTRQVALAASAPAVRERLHELRVEELSCDTQMDAMTFLRHNQRFHDTLRELAGSEVLNRLLIQLQLPQFQAIFFRLYSPKIAERSRREHLALLAAMLDGDGPGATDLMLQHVRATTELIDNMPDAAFAPLRA